MARLIRKAERTSTQVVHCLDDFIRVYGARLKPKEKHLEALGQQIRREHPWIAAIVFPMFNRDATLDPDAVEIASTQIDALGAYWDKLDDACGSRPRVVPGHASDTLPSSTNETFDRMRDKATAARDFLRTLLREGPIFKPQLAYQPDGHMTGSKTATTARVVPKRGRIIPENRLHLGTRAEIGHYAEGRRRVPALYTMIGRSPHMAKSVR